MLKFTRIIILSIVLSIFVSPFTNSRTPAYAANTPENLSDSVKTAVDKTVINDVDVQGSLPTKLNGKKVLKEVTGERTKNSKHYQLDDGTFAAVISIDDVHYEDENGQLHDIDTSLVDAADVDLGSTPKSKEATDEMRQISAENGLKKTQGSVDRDKSDYIAPYVPLKVRIPKDYSDGYSVGKGSDKLTFIPMGTNATIGVIESTRTNEITYSGAWDDTDVTLEVTDKGIKESLILRSERAPTMFTFEVNGGMFENSGEGGLLLQPAWLKDAKGTYRNVKQLIRRTESSTYVDLVVDTKDLFYPITIDPTVTLLSTGMDSYIANLEGWSHGNEPSLVASNYSAEAYLKFDLSSIASPDIVVTSSTLSLYMLGGQNSDWYYLYTVSSAWDENTINYLNKPNSTNTGIYSHLVYTNNYWADWNVSSLVQGWLIGVAANHGIKISPLSGNSSRVFASSDNSNSTIRPKLVINYYNASPSAPTIISPNGGSLLTGTTLLHGEPLQTLIRYSQI